MSNRGSWIDVRWRQVKRTTFYVIIFVCTCASQLLWPLLFSSRILSISNIDPDASFLSYGNQESLRAIKKSVNKVQSLSDEEHVPGTKTHAATEPTRSTEQNLQSAPYGEFCETKPLREAQSWNLHKKVISYSLFLEQSSEEEQPIPEWLWGGLIANVRGRSLYYPEWVIRVYTFNLSSQQIKAILDLGSEHHYNGDSGNIEVVRCHDDSRLNKLNNAYHISRFLTIDDPTVAYTIVRDLDSRFSPRELLATNEWISSGLGFHTMRDHKDHIIPVMSGMFGMKRGVLGETTMTSLLQDALEKYPNRIPGCCANDQNFLTTFVWPLVKSNAIAHDGTSVSRCKSFGSKVCRFFPLGHRSDDFFIGRPFKQGTQNIHWDCELECKESNVMVEPIFTKAERSKDDPLLSEKPLLGQPSQESTREQEKGPRSKHLYTCGYPGNHLSLLFPEHTLMPFPQNPDVLLQDASVSDDILILVGDGYKPTCAGSWARDADFVQFRSKFPGNILITNGESTGISAAPEMQNNVYRLGNYKPDSRSMRVTFCQLTLLGYGPAVWPKITDPLLRPKGSKERFVIYAASNCKPFRQEAAMRLADIGVVELGGRCQISHPQNGRVRVASDAVRKADWSQNHELFASYRFCLSMENEYVEGYVTEKILNAFLAGCIPIYYGSRPDVLAMFNEKAFVFYDINHPEQALARIRELETDSDAYDAVMQEPILANGTQTVAEYFSFTNDVENGRLAHRIREMMGLISPST